MCTHTRTLDEIFKLYSLNNCFMHKVNRMRESNISIKAEYSLRKKIKVQSTPGIRTLQRDRWLNLIRYPQIWICNDSDFHYCCMWWWICTVHWKLISIKRINHVHKIFVPTCSLSLSLILIHLTFKLRYITTCW